MSSYCKRPLFYTVITFVTCKRAERYRLKLTSIKAIKSPVEVKIKNFLQPIIKNTVVLTKRQAYVGFKSGNLWQHWILSPLMVDGVIGRPGHNVVWLVVVEHRVEVDLVPIPRHSMAAKIVVEERNKSAPAIISHAQVNNFSVFLRFSFQLTNSA